MAVKRFLHIMPDDKFLDYFIEQSEEVAPGESEYWIKVSNGSSPKLVKSKNVQLVDWQAIALGELLEKAAGFKKIFMHSFSLDMVPFIRALPRSQYLVWIFWGFEGYKFTANEKRWLLPETWKFKQKLLTKDVSWLRAKYRQAYAYRAQLKDSISTREVIKRVDCCATWVKYDYKMIQTINPEMKWADYSYYTEKQLGLDSIEAKQNDYSNIWVGNSAAITNNHLDALIELKSIGWQGGIYMPLSYGSANEYKQTIIKIGRELFGEMFYPIEGFLPLVEYQNLLNRCGIVWMNHIRQQAAGNIFAALYMGKKVILNPQSNLYKTLVSWGVKLNTSLKEVDFESDEINISKHNKELITPHISYDHILKCMEVLYS